MFFLYSEKTEWLAIELFDMDLLRDAEEEYRGTKYVDAGCSMPIISYMAFALITANTLANLIQV